MKTLNSLAAQQSTATEQTEKLIQHFLEYLAKHPDPKIQFFSSDMILATHSDASYMNEPGAKSTAAGYWWLKNKHDKDTNMKINRAINVLCKIIRLVCSSTAEAELAALFLNAKETIPIRQTLIDLDHPQPPADMVTDNAIASGIVNETMRQNKTRAMDMRYFWLIDQKKEGKINVRWRPGHLNMANYFTKHFHAPYHKKSVRYIYIVKIRRPI